MKFKCVTNRSVTGAPYNIKVTVCHTAGRYGEEYDDWNSDVFRSRRNCSSEDAEQTDGGRAFHARAAATGKARSPSVVRRVDGAFYYTMVQPASTLKHSEDADVNLRLQSSGGYQRGMMAPCH